MISVSGQGYAGTAGPGAGESDNGCNASTAGGGGAYGGSGGATPRARGGDPYGSPLMPVDLGSGGGNNPGCSQISTANAGGGAIRLNVSGVLQLDGAITADAASGLATRLGGGAGGSIYVTAGTLTGAGVFSANGADSGSVTAGGGGGGRIAVYYAAGGSFAGFVGSMANGGSGILPGAPGSVAFIDTSLPNHHLWVYQSLVFGEDTVLAYDALTLVNGATLRLGGGSTLDVAGEIAVRQNSMIVAEGKNTTQLVDGRWQGSGVTISAGRLTIETASSISADGHGYAGTAGPGAGSSESACNAAAAGGGGAYGGRGGRGTRSWRRAVRPLCRTRRPRQWWWQQSRMWR